MVLELRLSNAPLSDFSFNGSRFPEYMAGTATESRVWIVVQAPTARRLGRIVLGRTRLRPPHQPTAALGRFRL